MFAYFKNQNSFEIIGVYISGSRWHEAPQLRFLDRIPATKTLTEKRKIGVMRCYEVINLKLVCLNRDTVSGYYAIKWMPA